MHSAWLRLTTIVFFGLSTLAGLAGLTAFSAYFHRPEASVSELQISNIRALQRVKGHDRALLSFDVEADLAPVFNWNVKNMFAFIYAEYETASKRLNQVALWDKVIRDQNDARISFKGLYNKYVLLDQSRLLRAANVQLKLSWDVMPVTGSLNIYQSPVSENQTFVMPAEYSR